MSNPIDYALRVIESIAFTIHGTLGITEPFTGCLRAAFQDKNAMPSWFWPVAGLILYLVAYLNLAFGHIDAVVLIVQAYIAAFHIGAIFYHRILGHHPAVGVAPGFVVLLPFTIVAVRFNIIIALLGLVLCTLIAHGLSLILVKPNRNSDGEEVDSSTNYSTSSTNLL